MSDNVKLHPSYALKHQKVLSKQYGVLSIVARLLYYKVRLFGGLGFAVLPLLLSLLVFGIALGRLLLGGTFTISESLGFSYTDMLVWLFVLLLLANVFITFTSRRNRNIFMAWFGYKRPVRRNLVTASVENKAFIPLIPRVFAYIVLTISLSYLTWYPIVKTDPVGYSPFLLLIICVLYASLFRVLDSVWFIRKTRLPEIMAFFAFVALMVKIVNILVEAFQLWIL